ncbi:hypothetical protein ES703_67117 [subsurface metagenome]
MVKPLSINPGFNSWVTARELLMDIVLIPSEISVIYLTASILSDADFIVTCGYFQDRLALSSSTSELILSRLYWRTSFSCCLMSSMLRVSGIRARFCPPSINFLADISRFSVSSGSNIQMGKSLSISSTRY